MEVDSPNKAVKSGVIENIDTDFNKLNDADLIKLIHGWMQESATIHDELKRVQDTNQDYYKGNQTLKGQIPRHQSDVVDNRIFTSIETMIPIITSNPPQFQCIPAQETEASEILANSIGTMLSAQYEIKKVRERQREAIRYMLIYRLGILKPYWDEEINDVNVKAIRPQRVWIPEHGLEADQLPYVIEKVDMSFDEIEYYFGEAGLKKVQDSSPSIEDEKQPIEKVRTIWEVWTSEWVAWKYGAEILKKMKNPYWDWKGTKDESTDELRFYNHFAKARIPYIIKSPFTLGNSIVGDTDLIQQAIPLQDIVNTNLRQITNCANKMGNPQRLIDSSVMTQEETGFITNAPGQIIQGDGIADPSKFRVDQPVPLPDYIFENLVHAKGEIDNVMGVHSTTRGERGKQETLGGRILLKQADYGRIGDIVGLLEAMTSELGNWFVQLFKLYYDKEKTVKLYGTKGIQFVSLSRDNIEDGIEIIVKAGSTLPVDEISKRNEALELWQMGAIDPITFYERLKFPNPRETAEKLVAWKMGSLIPGQPQPEAEAGSPRQPGVEATKPAQETAEAGLRKQGGTTKRLGG